jgi:hypothetical protein
MSEERIQCKTPDCTNLILASTAALSGGICGSCKRGYTPQREKARASRTEIDPFAGVTDPVEIVRLLSRPFVHSEEFLKKGFPGAVDDFFCVLSAADVERIIELAKSYLPDEEDRAENNALSLAAFTTADLSVLQAAWLEQGSTYPGIIFRGASAAVRDEIIRGVESGELNRDHGLCALAWIGDVGVLETFARWREDPPSWRKKELHIAPHEYAPVGGWELTAGGGRRELISSAAFALLQASPDVVDGPVDIVRSADGACGWCGGPLTALFRFQPDDARIAILALPESVVTCTSCTNYSVVFMKLDAAGVASWHEGNRKPDFALEPGEVWSPNERLILGEPRGALHAAEQFLPTSFSQLGGAPCWIQDFDYPHCPDCTRTMRFIAQLAPDDFEEYAEGMYYVHWCDDCRVTATTYQQT